MRERVHEIHGNEGGGGGAGPPPMGSKEIHGNTERAKGGGPPSERGGRGGSAKAVRTMGTRDQEEEGGPRKQKRELRKRNG